ncbi:hypothetical protein LCGC14_1406460 [marine sediment metagenome]|uniref:Uncharacterized protein n=1 Tax=marine sediment metagenome TaxID=412755 RepID=A0A0F9KGH8_9ZZZZ
MTTAAQTISALFDDDGENFGNIDDDGTTNIDRACREQAISRPDVRDRGFDTASARYDFADGSSLVVGANVWDLGLPGGCHCGACGGHTDECASARRIDEMVDSINAAKHGRQWLTGSRPVEDVAADWITDGFDADSAPAWWDAGAFCEVSAAGLRDADLTPDECAVVAAGHDYSIAYEVSNSDMTVAEAVAIVEGQ